MAVTASQVFRCLEQAPALHVARHEIHCAPFEDLRHAVYRIILGLSDEDYGDTDIAGGLRSALSEWLTVPVPFSHLHLPALGDFGDPAITGTRWGDDIRRDLETALSSLQEIRQCVSPLRDALAEELQRAIESGRRWRIYCHRRAAEHFVACCAEIGHHLDPAAFIHSLRDYRSAEPFDLLIKVGPLRRRGWGAFPASCLNAPRYRDLVQFAWAGTRDETGVGDDPLLASWIGSSTGAADGQHHQTAAGGGLADTSLAGIRLVSTTFLHGDQTSRSIGGPSAEGGDLDELHSFSEMVRVAAPRRAWLLHLDNESGILYPPHAEVLLVDFAAVHRATSWKGELSEGSPSGKYLVRADIGDVNLGAHSTERGWFSVRWKRELERRFTCNERDLLWQLRSAGIRLRNLRGCVQHWLLPATTVIHAPQRARYFELLIGVLDMEALEPRPDVPHAALHGGEPRGRRLRFLAVRPFSTAFTSRKSSETR